jgi:hypothetical protein
LNPNDVLGTETRKKGVWAMVKSLQIISGKQFGFLANKTAKLLILLILGFVKRFI